MELLEQLKSINPLSNRKPDLYTFPKPGIYHYLREDRTGKVRLHLRVEADGNSMLLVNAARVYYFNPSATFMTYLILEQLPDNNSIHAITKGFNVTAEQARIDYKEMQAQIEEIISPDGLCPVCDMNLEIDMPFSRQPTAPYRMDLALTYRCNNDCAHCYNARPRQYPELDTASWKQILDGLWESGIPHIVFTGGEPTLRPDLPQLIAHAERNGQITGINTNGRRLKDPEFLQKLVDSGLDHVQITLESHEPAIHDTITGMPGSWHDTIAGLENVLKTRLFVMTNTTLLRKNSAKINETLAFLSDLGVQTVGLNALIHAGRGLGIQNELTETELNELLASTQSIIQDNGQRLIWYTPTQYCHFNPIDMNLGIKGCTAALYNMCIEPDGSVIPCQSYYQSLGNYISQSWESIWDHPLAVSIRQRQYLPESCMNCAIKQECGGGCPLARQAGAYAEPVSFTPQFDQPAI